MAALRSGRQVRIIDGRTVNMWRPFHSLLKYWTPRRSTCGVRSARLSCFGRHLPDYMASVPAALHNLDATHSITRRPFCSASPIWTPHTQSHGVQFCCSSQVGRHSTRTLASVPHSFPNLDASSVNMWRPIYAFIAIWTPCYI